MAEKESQENSEEQINSDHEAAAAASEAAEQSTDDAGAVDVDALTQQVVDLKDQMLRSMAEVENIKRRAAKDVENAHKFAVEKLINDLFPVLDSLEKAVETAEATEGAGPIAEGVALSLKLFVDTLAKSGVEQIDPLGEPFDPQKHEALTTIANPDAEPNSVMDVMAKGYMLNGRLVRAAKVIVVQG
jgi:molecular chaperone GrpE